MDKSVLIKKIKLNRGFTLVEILVSLAIFTMFITIALSALFVSNNSNKKATAVKTAIDNVQYAMEVFTRTARLGFMYNCVNANAGSVLIDMVNGFDCSLGQGVAFLSVDPTVTPMQTDAHAYLLENSSGFGRVIHCVDRGVYYSGAPIPTSYVMNLSSTGNCYSLTAKEIDIDLFEMVVSGSDPFDLKQPSIKVKVSGNVSTQGEVAPFYLQTFISQRQYE